MADIKQAARWMKQGKAVRRPFYVPGKATFGTVGIVYGHIGALVQDAPWCEFTTDDLLADDWEIAQ